MSVSALRKALEGWKAKLDAVHAPRLAAWSGEFLVECKEVVFPDGHKGPFCRLGWKAKVGETWYGNMVHVHPGAVLGEKPGNKEFEPLEHAAEWLLSDMEGDCETIAGNERRMAGIWRDLELLKTRSDEEARRKAIALEAQAWAVEVARALPAGFKSTCFVTDDAEGRPQTVVRLATEDESQKKDVPLSALLSRGKLNAARVTLNLP